MNTQTHTKTNTKLKTRPVLNFIQQRRRMFAFTQQDLADLLGHQAPTLIVRWERGTQWPSAWNLAALCCALCATPEQLYPDCRDRARGIREQREALAEAITARERRQHEIKKKWGEVYSKRYAKQI